ncbi:DNA polymerase III subunit gamma and tau [Lawsonella clevelandensis]|uniref:DNA polymerase III subunit gamma/tau n=1 Tax=Lawsonella clevelandensis TaxID=1528099 RepID=A0A2W5IDC5_9ACTN|nr:DNA polymerase III subunit gamma and tau [Lawsonella clevelandensis]PZP89093.1 MAG: DNA polymerase III subunit gamma/tau [Lawsonella clevelandensis]
MALYHKYRPATFAEVVGQEHVTEPLMQALDSGHINHAYLFSGPRGTGKTSSARILARSLNCAEGPTSTPCGKCASCLALAPGGPGNLDVTELDAASHGGVDDARELRDRAFYAPAESRYRVFIIDEAHMVTSAGFNALLKIVEEPPEHLIFIFATTEPEKVLPTIKSRTHHYPFRLLAPNAMRGLLERICEQEGVKVDPAVYPLVIRAGGGSPRDALSVLDQLMAGSGEDGITYQSALALLGATDVALIDDAVNALAAADRSGMFGTIERVIAAGHDPRRFTSDLLDRFRDLIMLQSVKDAADTGLVDAPDDQMERMIAQAKELGPATATRFADVLSTGLKDMRGATSPRLLLEIMSARMLLPATDDSYEALLQRVEQLERGVGSNISLNTPAHQNAAMEPPVSSAPHISREEAARNATEGTARIRAVMAEKKAKKEASQESQPVQAAASAQAVPAAQAASAGQSAQSASTAQSTPSTQTVESSENSSAASDLTAETFSNQWVAIRNAVRAQSRTLDVMLATARVVDYQPDTAQLSISHTSGPLVSRINEPRHIALLTDAIAHTLGVQVHVRCLTAQDAARSAGTSTTHDPAAQSASAQSHTAQSTSAQSYAERLQSARAHAKASPTGGVSHGGTSPASATPADPTGDATSSDGGPANSGPALTRCWLMLPTPHKRILTTAVPPILLSNICKKRWAPHS